MPPPRRTAHPGHAGRHAGSQQQGVAKAPSKRLAGPIWALVGIGAVLLAGWVAWRVASTEPAPRSAADFAPAPALAPLGAEAAVAKSQPPLAQPEQAAQPARDFSIETLTGERFSLAAQRGKVVGVLFVASWCGSCVAEAQAWGKLHREHGNRGLEVLLVSADPNDTPAELEQFRQWAKGAPERHWAIDRTAQALVVPYRVRSLDTTLIFDRQGRLAYRDALPSRYELLKQELEKLL